MEIERKIREDFEFYAGFTQNFRQFLKKEDNYLCEAWIHKLVEEQYIGIGEQNNRNIFLANLVLCIQKLKLVGPFLDYPPDWGLPNGNDVFGETSREIKEPNWLNTIISENVESNVRSKDGRTYLATKAMPDGKGALGYLAVSLADKEPQWIEKERGNAFGFDTHLGEKFEEYNPPIGDIERILVNRRNPEERERTLKYYDFLLNEIKKELDGLELVEENDAIEGLMVQLINDLEKRAIWQQYEVMPEQTRRQELLILLEDRLRERKTRLTKREEFLDHVEQKVLPDSFWETSCQQADIYKEDKEAYANKMWEQAINDGPKKKALNLLTQKYPNILVKRFLIFLARDKEKIAVQLQRRHENIVSQLKKELRKENNRGKKKCNDAQSALDEIKIIVERFKAMSEYVESIEQKRQEMLSGDRKEKDEMYNEIRGALLDTQQNVEAEAEHGKQLSDAINNINSQTEKYQKINEENIRKIEDSNIHLMKNIKKLGRAICVNEKRLTHLSYLSTKPAKKKDSVAFYA